MLHADPKAAGTGAGEAGDDLALEVAQAARFEFDAVERDNAPGGSKPQVAVGGLSDGVDAAGREAVLAGPGPAIVLEDGLFGVKRQAAGRGEAQDDSAPKEWGSGPRQTRIFAHTVPETSSYSYRRK